MTELYRLLRIAVDHPSADLTYTVVYIPSGETLSYHNNATGAEAAIRRYKAADKRRADLPLSYSQRRFSRRD